MPPRTPVLHVPADTYSELVRWTSRLRPAAMTLLVVMASLMGGMITASLWPVTVETDYYAADVHLSPAWGELSSIGTDTVVGSVSAEFAGVAPGVRIEPRVKPEITRLVQSGELAPSTLDVSAAERSRVVREAATGVALRFGAGALAGLGVVLLGIGLRRRGAPGRRSVIGGVLVTAVTCAGVGLGVQRTYAPDRLESLRSTGLLELAASKRSLLATVEERADEATPYLRNLLALSRALQQEYAPHRIPTETAVKALLVSDIHSTNEYALMRTIIAEQDIDVVIDSGDLLTFGNAEVGVSDLHRSISSLGVPYVFVRGNHDASSRTDTRMLEQMADTDGVVLLEPKPGEYQEVTVGGVRVAGFNDPRFFNDPLRGDADNQHDARDQWLEAWGERPAPDLTVSHEPAAVDDVPGQLRINGHMHRAELEGNRIQVGTFTGAGTLRHFIGRTDGELVGQPQAFDVLAFGENCRAQALTRYQFRSVLAGSPTYDSVSMVNAERIAKDVEEGRTCGGGDLEVESLAGE